MPNGPEESIVIFDVSSTIQEGTTYVALELNTLCINHLDANQMKVLNKDVKQSDSGKYGQ